MPKGLPIFYSWMVLTIWSPASLEVRKEKISAGLPDLLNKCKSINFLNLPPPQKKKLWKSKDFHVMNLKQILDWTQVRLIIVFT